MRASSRPETPGNVLSPVGAVEIVSADEGAQFFMSGRISGDQRTKFAVDARSVPTAEFPEERSHRFAERSVPALHASGSRAGTAICNWEYSRSFALPSARRAVPYRPWLAETDSLEFRVTIVVIPRTGRR